MTTGGEPEGPETVTTVGAADPRGAEPVPEADGTPELDGRVAVPAGGEEAAAELGVADPEDGPEAELAVPESGKASEIAVPEDGMAVPVPVEGADPLGGITVTVTTGRAALPVPGGPEKNGGKPVPVPNGGPGLSGGLTGLVPRGGEEAEGGMTVMVTKEGGDKEVSFPKGTLEETALGSPVPRTPEGMTVIVIGPTAAVVLGVLELAGVLELDSKGLASLLGDAGNAVTVT